MSGTPTPAVLCQAIETAWSAYIEREHRRASTPHAYVYASAWRPCERRMVLEMSAPDQRPQLPVEVLAKFRRGIDRERDLLLDLTRVGRESEPSFAVMGQQERFRLTNRRGREVIVGKVDARIQVGTTRAPLEVKAWSPQLVDGIDRFEDLFEKPWTRPGAYQLLSYLYGASEPYGFLLLDRAGLPAVIPVELDPHLDRVEEFLQKAERAVEHLDAGTLPAFLEGDAAECQRCPYYGATCNPPLAHEGVQVLTDPELEAMLTRHDAIKTTGKEFERLDKKLKERLRGTESGVAGAFQITGKWGKQSRVELPDAVRAQYTTTDPRGRFTLEITRLGERTPTESLA